MNIYFALPFHGDYHPYTLRHNHREYNLVPLVGKSHLSQFIIELSVEDFIEKREAIAAWMERLSMTDEDFDAILEFSDKRSQDTCVLIAFADSDQRAMFKMKFGGEIWLF